MAKESSISAVCENNMRKHLDDSADDEKVATIDLALDNKTYNLVRNYKVIGVELYTPDGHFFNEGRRGIS